MPEMRKLVQAEEHVGKTSRKGLLGRSMRSAICSGCLSPTTHVDPIAYRIDNLGQLVE